MSYTFTRDVGDGVKTVFPFSFAGQDNGYLRVTDITVYVAGTSVPFTVPTNDPNKAYLSSAPPFGAEVLIRRIMPKNVPYSDFARGNPFSQDTLNNTNLQQLYVVQELLDGFLPDGFYFKQNVNMGGHKLINLGEGTGSGDSVNWDQFDGLGQRVTALEGDLTDVSSTTIPFYYIASGGEVRWNVPSWQFTTALMFINGVFQNQSLGAFNISNNGFNFPEPLQAGDEVYVLLGSSVSPTPSPETDLTGVSSRTVPVDYTATGGEVRWAVPSWQFTTALMFINGVFQNQNLGAFTITNNGFNFPEPLQAGDEVYALLGSSVSPITDVLASKVYTDVVILTGGPMVLSGSGVPNGGVSAPIGSLYLRSDGAANTSLYVKESGTGDTGWVPK